MKRPGDWNGAACEWCPQDAVASYELKRKGIRTGEFAYCCGAHREQAENLAQNNSPTRLDARQL